MAEEATGAQRSSMFRFKGKPPPSEQSAAAVAGFVTLLSKHCKTMAGSRGLPGCETFLAEIDWRSALVQASEQALDDRSVKWFPEYGCALLAVGSPSVRGGPVVRRHSSIIGLDKWVFEPHWLHPPR
ncbi:unnamed protein product [Ectocarpus sp. CCAP 1310/34]|nr:unnamed protein product [Ectocarpus sp. CCAP 1310/34]